MATLSDAPAELQVAIQEFWPESEWDNAASVSELESGWNAFALADTTDSGHPCGAVIGQRDGVNVSAERSVGYFQINACNLPPDWEWQRLYNARHNAGTAHDMWARRGWQPWFFSATKLGLLQLTPEQLTALIGALATLATAVAGLIGAVIALYVKVEANRKAIDGRVNDLVVTARMAGHAEGVMLGQQLANPPPDEP